MRFGKNNEYAVKTMNMLQSMDLNQTLGIASLNKIMIFKLVEIVKNDAPLRGNKPMKPIFDDEIIYYKNHGTRVGGGGK